MSSPLGPRKIAGYTLAAILVSVVAVQFVLAIGPATARERASACIALRPTATNPVLGKLPAKAPDFQALDYTGKPISLSAYRGKVVLLSFWAPWCPPCVEEMPAIERLEKTLGREPFSVLGLVSEAQWPTVRDFFPNGTNLTVLLDPPAGAESGQVGNLARRYGTEKLPESYLIDKEGNVRFYFVNQREWDSPTALQCMQSLIDE